LFFSGAAPDPFGMQHHPGKRKACNVLIYCILKKRFSQHENKSNFAIYNNVIWWKEGQNV